LAAIGFAFTTREAIWPSICASAAGSSGNDFFREAGFATAASHVELFEVRRHAGCMPVAIYLDLVTTSWVRISGDNPRTIVKLLLLRAMIVAPVLAGGEL
jgi:hypothetical protein